MSDCPARSPQEPPPLDAAAYIVEAGKLSGCSWKCYSEKHSPHFSDYCSSCQNIAYALARAAAGYTGDVLTALFLPDRAAAAPASPLENSDAIVNTVTRIVRDADRAFQKSGGSSRHWVRDCFLPMLNARGLRIVDDLDGKSIQLAAPASQSADLDITEQVRFGNPDDELLPLTQCACGEKYEPWQFNINIYKDDDRHCDRCGRQMYFTNNIRVFQKVAAPASPPQEKL